MNSRVLLLVSLVLLAGASFLGFMAYRTTTNAQAEALAAQKRAEGLASEGKTAMVVLARAVQPYQILTEADLASEMVKHPLEGTSQDVRASVGRMIMTALPAGTPLVENHFNPGGQVARLLRPGERAVAIPVNDVVGGGGFLQPGDFVDIMLFLQSEDEKPASTQLVMSGVRVLSFGASLLDLSASKGVDSEKVEDGARAARNVREAKSAVLAISQADVSRLMLANSLGELRLAIVPTEELRQQQEAVAAADAGQSSEMLPPVQLMPVVSQKSAVPEQKYYLTDRALQQRAPVAAASAPRRAPVNLGPSVVIIRGLSSESK